MIFVKRSDYILYIINRLTDKLYPVTLVRL